MGTEVAERSSAVPAPLYDPASEIDSSDLALDRLKVGQYMHNAVQEGLVPAGAVFTESSADDPEPNVLTDGEVPLVFYVLSMRKGWSWSRDGELFTAPFDGDHPEDAWRTYMYLIAVPEHDEDMPYKFLLTRTGTPAAKQINTVLAKYAIRGPAHEVAFRLTTSKRENDKGKFFVPRVTTANVDKAEAKRHKEIVEKMLPHAEAVQQQGSTEEEGPAI